MSVKPYRATRTARTRSRKFSGRCEACGKPLCSCRAYQYTDESNGAITASAPFLCRDCYEQKYGVRIPTEVDAYKARLLQSLGRSCRRRGIRSCLSGYAPDRKHRLTDAPSSPPGAKIFLKKSKKPLDFSYSREYNNNHKERNKRRYSK